jgi:hypothetical protein
VLGGLAGQVIVILSEGITALLPALICNFALCDNPLKVSDCLFQMSNELATEI